MIYPAKQKFLQTAQNKTVLPIYTEILADLETPVSVFQKIKSGDYNYLLESVESGVNIGRFSFIGTNPRMIFKSYKKEITIIENNIETHYEKRNPLEFFEQKIKEYRPITDENLDSPFWGGPVGYMGYEMVHFFENLPDKQKTSLNTPDLFFVTMKNIVVYDQLKHKIIIIYNAFIDNNAEEEYQKGIDAINLMLEKFQKPFEEKNLFFMSSVKDNKVYSSFKRDNFTTSVEKIKSHIEAGDIFQCVLSQRFYTDMNVDSFNVYRSLRIINPSPYMFYFHFKDLKLIGSSPEDMVKKEKEHITIKPIAGTRPRGKTQKEDLSLEQDLKANIKENAEHLMLVDLGRNDVGRIAEKGTVKVDKLKIIERYSHVMHIVSTVTGKINPSVALYDLIRAVFPAGTVSGAPKIRAMEIIEDLEPVKRGIYAGLVGYYSFTGNFDSCITIRTIVAKDNKYYVQAGAGIVADSKPEKEYEETVNKAKALFKAIEIARGGLQ